jgi:hypothetical protein
MDRRKGSRFALGKTLKDRELELLRKREFQLNIVDLSGIASLHAKTQGEYLTLLEELTQG